MCVYCKHTYTHTIHTTDGKHARRLHRGGRMSGQVQEAMATGVPREGRFCAHHWFKVLQGPALFWRCFCECFRHSCMYSWREAQFKHVLAFNLHDIDIVALSWTLVVMENMEQVHILSRPQSNWHCLIHAGPWHYHGALSHDRREHACWTAPLLLCPWDASSAHVMEKCPQERQQYWYVCSIERDKLAKIVSPCAKKTTYVLRYACACVKNC